MTITLPTLSALRVNPEWAELPLFDRRGWSRVRFGDVVENCNETCDPESAGIDRFIAMEHLEPGSLHVRSWGDVSEGTTFTRRCRPGQVLFGKRRAYQRKIAVAEFEAVVSGDIYVLGPKNDRLIPELLPFLCLSERFSSMRSAHQRARSLHAPTGAALSAMSSTCRRSISSAASQRSSGRWTR